MFCLWRCPSCTHPIYSVFCVYSTAIQFCKGGGWPRFSIFNVLSSFNWDNNYLIVSGTELSAFHIDSCAVLRARHYGEETEAQRRGELAKFICRLRGGGGFEPNQRPGAFTSSLKTTAQGNQEELGAARATLLGVSHWVSPPLSPQLGSSWVFLLLEGEGGLSLSLFLFLWICVFPPPVRLLDASLQLTIWNYVFKCIYYVLKNFYASLLIILKT